MAEATPATKVNELVRDIIEGSRYPSKSRPVNLKPIVAELASAAYDGGLLPDALTKLVDILAAPGFLDQATLASLLRNFYPAEKIPRGVVLRIVSALGLGKAKTSLNVQAGLLRWLIQVYHLLDEREVLGRAYPVLFNLLDAAAIRPQLTHLLALITRRKHVQPFRIQALLILTRQTGNDPCLVGLLRVYKDYYPEIIVGDAIRAKASAFKHPDPQWRARLDEIQTAHLQRAGSGSRPGELQSGFSVHRRLGRSSRKAAVPLVQTSHATEDSITLEEIDNVHKFVESIDKLELPNQLVAVLADPLLQKYLLLRPGAEAYQRIANWLGSELQGALDGDIDENGLWDVLEPVRDFIVQSKVMPPLILNFLAQFFEVWDGSSGSKDLFFEILSYVPFHKFDDLYRHIFRPLEEAVADGTSETQTALLMLYTNILHHWTTLFLISSSPPSSGNSAVSLLVQHVNDLAVDLIQICPDSANDGVILSFYEQTANFATDQKLKQHFRIELPPASLVYTLLFRQSLSTVSRLCQLLASFKKGFEMAVATQTRTDTMNYDHAYVNLYNGYLMDICNCFWRQRAFDNSGANARGCMLSRATVSALTTYATVVDRSIPLGSLFSLSFSPLLCLGSIQCVRELEDAAIEKDSSIRVRHAGPVTPNSLNRLAAAGGIRLSWQEYKVRVLESLRERGLSGVSELLRNMVSVLRNSADRETSTPSHSPQKTLSTPMNMAAV